MSENKFDMPNANLADSEMKNPPEGMPFPPMEGGMPNFGSGDFKPPEGMPFPPMEGGMPNFGSGDFKPPEGMPFPPMEGGMPNFGSGDFKPPEGMPPFDPENFDPENFDPEKFAEMLEKGELPDFPDMPKKKGLMKLFMPKMPDMKEMAKEMAKEAKDNKTGMERDNPGYRPLVRPDSSKMKNQRRGGPRGGPPGMRGEKPKDFKGSIKQLAKYLLAFKWLVVVIALCSICSTILATVNPKILAKATNEIVRGVTAVTNGGTNGVDFSYVGRIIMIMMTLYIVSMLFSYIQGFTLAYISAKISYNLRNAIIEKINRLPINFFHTLSNGEVMSRITNDVDSVSNSLQQCLTQIISALVTLIGVLVMMLSISWKLTLVAIIMLPFSGIFTALVVGVSQKHFRNRQKLLGTVNGYVEEMYAGQMLLKAFCGEERAIREFEYENERLYTAAWKAEFLTGMMMPITSFIGNLGYMAICVLGASMCARGTILIGDIQAFITYVKSFNQPITQIANISSQLQSTAAAAERVFAFLNEEEEKDDAAKPELSNMDVHGDVEFKNVRFGYNPEDIVIKNFSAKVKAGQKVAIVGPTGAGKTTMVKLLMRFHDLQGGAIYLDGHDTREIARTALRSNIGMVLQDTWLYNDTIMENIRYGRLDATDEEVIEAAKAAQVDFFIRTQADGYNMILNEETSNISAGQKQLLTIARAILADTKLLILDEATSSVDTRTEMLIQKAMDNLMKGRTSFVIAHRLSTIKNADLILCMKDGDIVEQGSHDELMAANGFYAQLYNSQFERVS